MRFLRLNDEGEFSLVERVGTNVPPYAILSHTWGADNEEVTFKDLIKGTGKDKTGYRKLIFCGTQAAKDNLTWFWVDTCCINKASSTELSEAINSMFQWYKEANKCYVYLPDVSIDGFAGKDGSFQRSRWFTRGWTLQELLAPIHVDFFSVEGIRLGDKIEFAHEIAQATGISIEALRGKDLSLFSVDERFKWAKDRETKREEDFAYSLLGIFGIHMSLIYGEGKEKALERLKKKVKRPARKTPTHFSTLSLHFFLSIFIAVVAIFYPTFHKTILSQSINSGHFRWREDDIWRNDSVGPWLVPFMRPASFVGREAELSQLNAHISSNGGRWLAIYGLGGCGKTAIALESAYRTREQHPTRAVFWVPAITRESFEQAYYEIGALLYTPEVLADKVDVKNLVKAKLSDESFGHWLMIIDNADDISILLDHSTENSSTVGLVDYIPRSQLSSIIFTTRSREAAVMLAESTIELGQFQKSEATELLRSRLLKDHHYELENQETVENFLDTLTFLALAIVQAVAFINVNDISLSEYILYYRNNEKDAMGLLNKQFHDHMRYADTKNPIATTWYISFAFIKQHNALAAEYLSFMACISNIEISGSMLPLNGSVVEQVEAIGMLKAYAFITEGQPRTHRQPEQIQNQVKSYDVHPLVHMAMRGWLKEQNQWTLWVGRTLDHLEKIIPHGGNYDPKLWTKFLPHAVYITNIPESYNMQGRLLLLRQIAMYKTNLGDLEAAALALQNLLEVKEHLLGQEHPDTLDSMDHLGFVLNCQEKYEATKEINQQALEMREKSLGKGHPDTLSSMNNLAKVLEGQGKYKEAEDMIRKVLEGREKALGKAHPDTLTSLSKLVIILRLQGKYKAAEAMSQQVLGWTDMILEREHFNITGSTFALLNQLLSQLLSQGDCEAAEEMNQRLIEWYKKELGTKHPATLAKMHTLANILVSQGRYDAAEAIGRQTLEGRKDTLGENHYSTLATMDKLAAVLRHQGKYEEAEEIIRSSLERRENVLGKEHPDTLADMNDLAGVLGHQGKYKEAEEIMQQAFEGRENILGKEHPDTLASMYNLASLLRLQGKYKAAETIGWQELERTEKALGKEHPDTLTSMDNLIIVLRHQGKYEAAEGMLRGVLERKENVLGKEHPDTLADMSFLAVVLGYQEKYEAAEEVTRETLKRTEKALGKEHSITHIITCGLADLLSESDQCGEALLLYERASSGLIRTLGLGHSVTQECLNSQSSVQEFLDGQAIDDTGHKVTNGRTCLNIPFSFR